AFAVAAFLEPEILVIDEVLAVGDAEFQKKAIGKMQDISKGEGRTVLFVSHNMAAVKSLCTRGIVLENGKVVFEGGIEESIEKYNSDSVFENETQYNGIKIIKKALLHSSNGLIKYNCSFKLDVYFEADNNITNLVLGLVIKDLNDVALIGVNNRHYHQEKINSSDTFNGMVTVYIESLKLFPGEYKIDLYLGDSATDIEIVNDAIKFTIGESFDNRVLNSLNFKLNKVFHDTIVWRYNKIND
ncbi:Wzt carbohydrate-binding domain-containing protein, partial [Flavobacterium sp. XS1P32]